MTPTPPSATTSSSNSQFSPDGQFRVVRKRNRVPLSCAPCRNRKLKCNRSQPCENCIKRGDSISCSYAAPGVRKKNSTASSSGGSPDDMQNRIDRLEGLVLSLMTTSNGSQSSASESAQRAMSLNSGSVSADYPQDVDIDESIGDAQTPADESDTDQMVQSLGVMRVDNNKSMYFSDAHWAAVLSDISEVKNYFQEHKKQVEEQIQKVHQAKQNNDSAPQGPTSLFGGARPPPFSELLAQLPKRSVCDKLVARYFTSYDPAVHILHPPSWYRMYEKYWEDPEKSNAAWLGQMYAIFCLAMHSYYRMEDEPPEFRGQSLALAASYRSLTGQCLLLADFTKPISHMIETMVLHLHCEYARTRDAEVGVWVLVGMIVRLAMRMGYHRDPKYYPTITPFQGEIRRRVWTFVRQSDLLFSFQIGLPSMIRLGDCDTELPRNLYDDEFDEDTKELPASRPNSEPTPVSYMRAKANMSFAFGKVVERLHLVVSPSYDEIMALDQELRDALADLPPHLRMRTLDESIMDPGALVMQRFNLSILYHKGQCVLHRKFLARARENNRYAHSRRTCVDSSMELLSHQATLHHESGPKQRLHGMKVFISSLTAADFLLAAMIVSLDLYYGAEAEGAGQGSGDLYTWGLERRSDMIKALEVSRDIWMSRRDQSIEAFKASEVLTVMLKKMKTSRNQAANAATPAFPFPPVTNNTDSNQKFRTSGEEKPEHSAAMTLGMLSSGGMSQSPGGMYNGQYTNANGNTTGNGIADMQASALNPNFSMDPMSSGVSAPSPMNFFGPGGSSAMDLPTANLDWDAWDSYIQNASLDPGNQVWPVGMDPVLAGGVDGQNQPSMDAYGSNGGNMPL